MATDLLHQFRQRTEARKDVDWVRGGMGGGMGGLVAMSASPTIAQYAIASSIAQ